LILASWSAFAGSFVDGVADALEAVVLLRLRAIDTANYKMGRRWKTR